MVIRDEPTADDPGDDDWVYFDLSTDGLDELGFRPDADGQAYPEVDDRLVGFAQRLYAQAPFPAAGIGLGIQGPWVLD